MFLEMYLLPLGCPICWHITIHSSLIIFCISVIFAVISLSFLILFNPSLFSSWDSLVAQLVKNPPAMRQTWV